MNTPPTNTCTTSPQDDVIGICKCKHEHSPPRYRAVPQQTEIVAARGEMLGQPQHRYRFMTDATCASPRVPPALSDHIQTQDHQQDQGILLGDDGAVLVGRGLK